MNRKLIEVALPLDAISAASRRDKDRKTGTIKNVHKWFAPMPTPAWRALLFASIVDDPGTDEARQDLLDLIEDLVGVDGKMPTDKVLERARKLMAESGTLPTVLDPFCGGGSTIVEAQRLGLPAVGSDLNPVPVLITKVLCELVPAVAARPPLVASEHLDGTGGPLTGFFADLRHYAERVREVAWEKVGHLYPSVPGGTVVAWLWARTVTCPNPACGATIPLYSSPWLSKRKGQERWLRPVVNGTEVRFEIGTGREQPPAATKLGRGPKFRCPVCFEACPDAYLKSEGMSGRLGYQAMCRVVDVAGSGREYFAVEDSDPDDGVGLAPPEDAPFDSPVPEDPRNVWCKIYGLTSQGDFYTARQLHAMGAFADAVAEVAGWVAADGGDEAYARAITAVLGLSVGKLAQSCSTQVRWNVRVTGGSKAEPAFARHALPMVWDFAETNPFGTSVGAWNSQVASVITGLRATPTPPVPARIEQSDARSAGDGRSASCLVATDPPYFGQIGYADLSDYFYVWHRRALRSVLPDLYGTISTPKDAELIASPYRHGGDSDHAHRYYVDGFTGTFRHLASAQRPDLPMLVVYAHRQEESNGAEGLTSSAWDALLEAMLRAGVGVVGTWPIHATRDARMISIGTNSLASYIVLVCRPRQADAGITDRPGFVRALRSELPEALRKLQAASTLPFDLTQAAIGPGMAIFSRFARVVEPSGEAMRVKTAIGLINQVRSEILSEQDDEFDAETRWAIQWFEHYAFDTGPFGEAEKLFTATATSLDGLRRTGIVATKAPEVWLRDPESLPTDWDPVTDQKPCTWEVTMHLLRVLHSDGETEAGALLAKVGHFGDLAHDLAYRIADICESTKRASTALLVNGLVASWPEVSRLAASLRSEQGTMF